MFSQKHINLFLILLMLGAQLALAKHTTVHFAEEQAAIVAIHAHDGDHSPINHDHDSDSPQVTDLCQFYLFAKDCGHTLTPESFVFSAPAVADIYRVSPKKHTREQTAHRYFARAPPVFLI